MIIKTIRKTIELSKSGNPYARVVVQFDEYRDHKGNMAWISGFGNQRTWAWKVGDDVAPQVTQEGKYYNFTFDDTEENKLDVYRLPATIGFVMSMFKKPQSAHTPAEKTPQEKVEEYANDEINPADIPF